MEHLSQATAQIRQRVWLVSFVLQLATAVGCFWLYQQGSLEFWKLILVFIGASLITSYIAGKLAGSLAKLPLQAMGQAILHIAPSQSGVGAPKFEQLRIGREYVTNLAYQLYEIASLQDNKLLAEHRREATQASNILSHFPLPIFVFNKQQLITFASDSALAYCDMESAVLFGKPLFDAVDLEFPSGFTLESWITDCQKDKVTDTAYWRRVRLNPKTEAKTIKQCDMAAFYNRDNPKGVEFVITLFDRTDEYNQDDESLSFVALAVHELRTPLTLLRGYIEVFEEEFAGKLDNEMTEVMRRMKASSRQFSAFVNNILNVARIEQDQLEIKLSEEKWADIVKSAGADMEIRAHALGKEIIFDLSPDLPAVAADRATIYEVLYNLLDNAIKYSGNSKQVSVKASVTKDGLVETLVTDQGVGIPASVIPSLFEKFHRNHRNRAQVSGTGLGLYLSKTIINAHGGDIWVKSKENEGTTVGFTLKPYAMLADELKSGDNKDDLVRTAHGWIKNHSLYRR